MRRLFEAERWSREKDDAEEAADVCLGHHYIYTISLSEQIFLPSPPQ
jgi:hypothetical protein